MKREQVQNEYQFSDLLHLLRNQIHNPLTLKLYARDANNTLTLLGKRGSLQQRDKQVGTNRQAEIEKRGNAKPGERGHRKSQDRKQAEL